MGIKRHAASPSPTSTGQPADQAGVQPRAAQWPRLGPDESAFLLALLRGDPLPETGPGFDWPTLARRARTDGLAPLIYHRLKANGERLPGAVEEQIRQLYYQNVSVNHLRLEELRRLGQRFQAEGIRLLALKGAALALTVYEDPALRFMGDLDLAVPPADAHRALALLQADGYVLLDGADELEETALLHREGWHLRLARELRGKRLELELHWPLRQAVLVNQVVQLDVQRLWATAVPLTPDQSLWQPSPPFMLFHLCVHAGLHHRFGDLGLRQFVDLDRLIRARGAADGFWPVFTVLARTARAAHVCYFTLQLARQLLGTPLPDAELAALRPSAWKAHRFAQVVQTDDVVNRTRLLFGPGYFWWRWLTTDQPADLLGGPWRVLFPGRAFLADYYGQTDGRWLAAYALWHPFHALARASRRRLKLIRDLAGR